MWQRWIRDGHRVFDRLARLRQPTIAAIGGIAYGGGLELALACDLRIAAAGARFAFPEVTIGAVPGWAGSQRLPRVIGAGRAKQMILAGEPIDAATAAAWGLVNEVVPADRLATRALELARRIAENAPTAVQAVEAAGRRGRRARGSRRRWNRSPPGSPPAPTMHAKESRRSARSGSRSSPGNSACQSKGGDMKRRTFLSTVAAGAVAAALAVRRAAQQTITLNGAVAVQRRPRLHQGAGASSRSW